MYRHLSQLSFLDSFKNSVSNALKMLNFDAVK